MCIAMVSPCPTCGPELPCVCGAARSTFHCPSQTESKTENTTWRQLFGEVLETVSWLGTQWYPVYYCSSVIFFLNMENGQKALVFMHTFFQIQSDDTSLNLLNLSSKHSLKLMLRLHIWLRWEYFLLHYNSGLNIYVVTSLKISR